MMPPDFPHFKNKYLRQFLYWWNWEASAENTIELPINTMEKNMDRLEKFLERQGKNG
jgi:hypothetical protein